MRVQRASVDLATKARRFCHEDTKTRRFTIFVSSCLRGLFFVSSWPTFVALVIACSILAGVAAAQSQRRQREDLTEFLPPGAWKAFVAQRCSSCHELNGMIQLRESKQGWQALVYDMVARGAPLTVEEADQTVAYLNEAFGAAAPPLVDVNTAAKDDLVKLPGVTAPLADRLITHRTTNGPLTSRDQVRTVLGLDERAFDRIKWYVRTGAPSPSR